MKKNIVIAVISLVFLAIPLCAAAQGVTGTPAAVIQDGNYEFGPVLEGTMVVHEFIAAPQRISPKPSRRGERAILPSREILGDMAAMYLNAISRFLRMIPKIRH